MPLNKLDNFIKNTEGRILYVSPSDLDSTDSISNQGNSLAQPFKTLQRALVESARFSYLKGNSNDLIERTTILLMPGEHVIDNRPGYALRNVGGIAKVISPDGGSESAALDTLTLKLDSNFDLNQANNILYKFNSVYGGVVVPRGTSVVGLDLRKTKLRPLYVPNPTDVNVADSAIFRITGGCYFWQFSVFDGNENGLVYTDSADFSVDNKSKPIFSHHKLTCFEYADGVNDVTNYNLTDLDMYYAKLSNAYNIASGRDISSKYPSDPYGFEKQRPEWEIVGAFATDPITISTIEAGSGGTPTNQVTVVTSTEHGFQEGTPIKIEGVSPSDYNISTMVQSVSATNPKEFTYLLPEFRKNLPTPGSASGAQVSVETDTVSGSSPYIFNCSLRSVYGLCGMKADGSKASGFRSMVVAQFTGVSLQKDDRAFVKYNKANRSYEGISTTKKTGASLANESSSSNSATVYHLDSNAVYRNGWENAHIKITNDAILQIVSVFAIGYNRHFSANTGGDASITNSNSNFGQLSLTATGFKKNAFTKDNKAFITNIIAPKAITTTEENIDWNRIDVGVTTSVANNKRLYLYGYTNEDIVPPVLTQGYRVGAKVSDKLYVNFSAISGYGTSEANILMSDDITSSVKEYKVTSGPSSNRLSILSNTLTTGEKVLIKSDDGDLPENLEPETIYYVIDQGDDNRILLASSKTDAENGTPITIYGGTNLRILSRVSDKVAGDLGHPVQWDANQDQWYINTNAGNDIYTAITQVGVQTSIGLDASTETSYIKRISDSRSLDEKIYKLRVVIPKELPNSKNPESGFIIQESSTTGVRSDTDFSLNSISLSDYEYDRNPRFIGSCTFSSTTVSVRAELPHDLDVGDQIIVKNVTDSSNPIGAASSGYNGTYEVVTVPNDMEFTYTTGRALGPALTNNINNRTTSLPRFERNDLQSNLYIYRNQVISEYIDGQQDGIYHAYALGADTTIPTEFTDYEYSQNVVDLYPQLDRDNIDDSPLSAESFALRSPLGNVQTSDLKKSITRKASEIFVKKLDQDLTVSSEGAISSGKAILTLTKNHGLSGIVTGTITGGSGHVTGTYYNVKLWNEVGLSSWDGATAVVGVSGGAVNVVDIQSPGSGYQDGDILFIDKDVTGGSTANAKYTVATAGLTGSLLPTGSIDLQSGMVVQVTGIGTTATDYYRAVSIPTKNQISIAKTVGDPNSCVGQSIISIGAVGIVTSATYNSSTDTTTIVCPYAHGLVAGNRFKLTDSSDNNLGNYLVQSKVGIKTFTVSTDITTAAANGYILKHGLSANDGISDKREENIAARGMSLYCNETLKFDGLGSDNTKLKVSSPSAGIGTAKRFKLGSYIQIDNEIMRISSNTLTGISGNELTVLRGVLGTGISTHEVGSFIQKVRPVPVEFRRPSILRASGHTFEYLGYGPGNYSTGLPQLQNRTLTEREEFLSQSQERSAGVVVYTGMNSKGDFYIGNRKTSSATGEEISFDVPVPTVTGEDPARLSAVFDEVTIKERLVVEGGDSGQLLSEFDGPVTFNNEVKFNDSVVYDGGLKISSTEPSTSRSTGALVVSGGVGIGGTVNLGIDADFRLVDDGQITLGNDNDLSIYYDSTNSHSRIVATDTLRLQGKDVKILNSTAGEVMLQALEDGPVHLYHNNGLRLSTSGVGVTVYDQLDVTSLYVSGITTFSDDTIITAGGLDVAGIVTATAFHGDLIGNITGTVTGSSAQITLVNESTDTTCFPLFAPGSTGPQYPKTNAGALTYNAGSGTLRSTDFVGNLTGNVTGDLTGGDISGIGSNITALNASNISTGTISVSRLGSGATSSKFLRGDNTWQLPDASTLKDGDGTTRVEANTGGIQVTGVSTFSSHIHLGDDDKLYFGDSLDLQIYHDTTNSVIKHTSSSSSGLYLSSNKKVEITDGAASNIGLRFNNGGNHEVELFYNSSSGGAARLKTTATGIEIGNSSLIGNILAWGDITAYYSSDRRLKDNILPIKQALDKVKSISGNTFDWNEASGKEGSEVGVIAQEVDALNLPGITTLRDNGTYAVRYEKLVPVLIEAIKELSAKVDNLEQKLSDK